MSIKKIFNRLHQKQPKLGQAVSFVSAAATITASSTLLGIPLLMIGTTKIVAGSKVADNAIISIAKRWIHTNNTLIDTILPKRDWRIEMPEDLDESKQYLLISNHLSWVDTSIVQYISEGRLPLTRFFTKYNLIYIPFVGQAFYLLDFPMIKRQVKIKNVLNSQSTDDSKKDSSAKNSKLRDDNIQEAKRACQLLQDKPFALLNYLEGTRFTKEKQAQYNSPYQHLLKPKAGGITLAIQALGQQIDGILDITLVYPDGSPAYDDLWKGKVRRLGVHVRRIDIPEALFAAVNHSDYHSNDAMKKMMYAWLDEIWRDKDEQITRMLADFADNEQAITH